MRGLQPAPIHTFQKWKDLGRFVKRGERALTLCMPITIPEWDADRALSALSTERRQLSVGPGFCVPINQVPYDRTKFGGFNRFWHKHLITRLQSVRSIFYPHVAGQRYGRRFSTFFTRQET